MSASLDAESTLPSPQTTFFLASGILTLVVLYFYNAPLFRWLKLKHYQWEVTVPLYLMTSMEKFVFYSILFLIVSMIIIAASLYLPEHIATIGNRMWYYVWGDGDEGFSKVSMSTAANIVGKVTAQ